VVDASGALLGAVPPQALLQVLRREHVEDLHLLTGITRENARARHAIDDPPMRRARHRLPWLLAGLAGSAAATAAMAGFEDLIQAHVAVAFFVPALVYLADAIGTQSEAIAVRGLSLTRSGIGHLVAGELRTGAVIGSVLGRSPSWRWRRPSGTCASPARSAPPSSPPGRSRAGSASPSPGGSRRCAWTPPTAAAPWPPSCRTP